MHSSHISEQRDNRQPGTCKRRRKCQAVSVSVPVRCQLSVGSCRCAPRTANGERRLSSLISEHCNCTLFRLPSLMRMPLHPAKNQITLPGVLFALSDPTRLKIVRAIAGTDGLNCCDIPLELSKSTASRHFKVLREAGVIRMDPHGVVCINSLRRQDLDDLFPGLIDSVLSASARRRGLKKAK
jgi:DNA-binding transcriptional ArsR family regulator